MFLSKLGPLVITTFLLTVPVIGQTTAATSTEVKSDEQKKAEAQKALTAQALELLEVVIKDTDRLTLPQNRAFLSVTTAELLWQYDEAGARALLKNAAEDLRAALTAPVVEGPRSYSERADRAQLRERILLAMARRDGRLARDLLVETRPMLFEKNEGRMEGEADLEARIAAVIAANDPSQALEMAEKTLAKGFSSSLPNLLVQIQQKDREMAAKLADEILAKLKTVNLATNQEAASLAIRLLQKATEPLPQQAKSAKQSATPLLSEQSLRDLAELISAAALENTSEMVVRSGFDYGSVMTQLDKYAPSRAAQLRRRSAQTGTIAIDEDQQQWQRYQQLSENGTVETLLAAGDKADPGMRESYYRQAALKMVGEDKVDSARQLITDKITDSSQSENILMEIDRLVLANAAAQGKLDETRKYLSLATTVEERITTLSQLAMVIAQKGNKKLALQLLEEARNLFTGRPKYSRQFLAQLAIARAYASVDPAQSLVILETSIDQLNELISAGILLGEFFAEDDVIRNDELLIVFVGQLSESFQSQYSKDLGALATADFARTRDVAEKFQRFEVRLMARLLIAQSVLVQTDDKATTTGEHIETKREGVTDTEPKQVQSPNQ